jgi:hypothetical protein
MINEVALKTSSAQKFVKYGHANSIIVSKVQNNKELSTPNAHCNGQLKGGSKWKIGIVSQTQ